MPKYQEPDTVTDEALIAFARVVLWRMTRDKDWDAETTDAIAHMANDRKLARLNGCGGFEALTVEAQDQLEQEKLEDFRDAYARALEQPRSDTVAPICVLDFPGKPYWKIGIWDEGIDAIVVIDTQRVVPRLVTPGNAVELCAR
jgi:hypothetical protein